MGGEGVRKPRCSAYRNIRAELGANEADPAGGRRK